MKYKPIFSNEIEENENDFVSLIGKVINVRSERKYIEYTCLDKYGYFKVISFDIVDISEFSTVIVLGKIKRFNNNLYVYSKRIISIDQKEEIFWRKSFIETREQYEKIKGKRKIEENKEDKKQEENEEEKIDKEGKINDMVEYDKETMLKVKILKYIKDKEEVSFEELLDVFNISEEKLREAIDELLASGEIYESSPDKYKII